MGARIGTSGWAYNHWRRIFYPEDLHQRHWFSFYARLFDTVEINNTFYRLPCISTFDRWRTQAPSGFIYAVKANRLITHLKKLKDPEGPLQMFIENVSHLGSTLGPILYQLPPNWQINLQRFEHFLTTLPKGYRHVIEFREASWFNEEAFHLMEHYQIAHCLHDMSPLEVPIRITAPLVYVRFHGDPKYGGHYQTETLETWARRIDIWQSQLLDVFAYFNNDIGGYALDNAKTLNGHVELIIYPLYIDS